MRTTLDLPDDTFRQLKSLAAQRGTTLKALMRQTVERELAGANGETKRRRRLKFPLIPSKEPGTLNLTNAEIEELLT